LSNPFVAEIRITPFNFAPKGWAMCNGQLLPISQNTALFSLLGTTYGGDGKTTFALPNLQGCAPMQAGQGSGLSLRDLGETGGEQTVTLLQTEIPSHTHATALGTKAGLGNQNTPVGHVLAEARIGRQPLAQYSTTGGGAAMSAEALATSGGNLPHNNMPPFLTLNFIIALQGVFPARS
jgi:microcystin-dependent protein